MFRARFKVNIDDPRPVVWPIKHPYWITGYDGLMEEYTVIVAYVDNMEELMRLWPDAHDIDMGEGQETEYIFTSRFPRPDWLA